jgi:hypothetical protein
MTIPSPRRLLAAALATGAAGTAAVALLAGPATPSAAPAPAPATEAAAPGLCLDLSALALPSVCVGSLLPPGTLG